MRYLVLTDIHANLEALDTCLADALVHTYDATLVHACGVETVHFETSDVGEDPLAVDPTGWLYAIDLGTEKRVGLGK